MRILVAGLLLAALAACGDPGPAATTDAGHEPLAAGDQPRSPPPTAASRWRVIGEAATLERLFRAMTGRAAPDVDFARHRVLLLDAGPQSSAGHALAVGGVRRTSGGLVVEVVLRRPGEGCMSATVMTRPYAFVRIPADGGPVRLRERVERVPCG